MKQPDTNMPQPMFPDTDNNGIIGYMCLTDFEYELGNATGGNVIYPTASEALCKGSCGVVEVEIVGRKTIVNIEDYDDESESNIREDMIEKLKKYDKEYINGV